MDKETIKKLYLVKAQLKHMNFIDPMKPAVEQAVDALEAEYVQHMHEVNFGEKAKPAELPWQLCLQYVAEMFNAFNKDKKEEKHEEQVKFREMVWTVISNAVSNYYCQQAQKKPEA